MHSAASAEKGLESAAVQKHPSRHEPSTGRLVARSDCGNRETRGPRVAMGFLGGNDLECEKPYRNHTIGRASRAPTRIAAAAQRGLRMVAQVTDQRLKSDTIVKCDSIPFSRMDWPPYPTPSPSHMHPPHTWHPVPVLASHIPLSHMHAAGFGLSFELVKLPLVTASVRITVACLGDASGGAASHACSATLALVRPGVPDRASCALIPCTSYANFITTVGSWAFPTRKTHAGTSTLIRAACTVAAVRRQTRPRTRTFAAICIAAIWIHMQPYRYLHMQAIR